MPPLLYGTAWKKERTRALVERALAAGFRGVDTACQPKHYDEALVGVAVSAALGSGLRREDLYLQTKFTPLRGHDPRRVPYDPKAPLEEQVRTSVGVSLTNLKTSYLDAVLLHSPLPTFEQTLRAWRTLEDFAKEGTIRALGISNCYELTTLAALYEAAHVKPSIVQNRFYAETGYDRELRAWGRPNAITYQSFWTLSANPHILAHRIVTELASRYQVTASQVLFRALTQLGVVPLTGTTDETHMRESLAIFAFELDANELAGVNALFE